MLQEERLVRIRHLLATFARVDVDRIVQDLGVSRETVRRDLVELEQLGALRRVHGGAVSLGSAPEPPLGVRMAVRRREKRAIAQAAVALLEPGQTLFLDAGSTTTILADELAALTGMVFITNSLAIALKLANTEQLRESRNKTLLLGGEIDVHTQATYGEATVEEVRRFRADVAMLSPVALHARQGAMSFEHREAAVARAMASQAQRLVVLADHSKVGQTSRVAYAKVEAIDTVVTDRQSVALPGWSGMRKAFRKVVVT